MFSEHIVLTLITLCYVLPVCSSDQDSCWQNSRLINTLLCHLYRTPLHQTIQDSWIYVELQISRLIILCRVTSVALLHQIGTHSRALRGYWRGSLDFSTSNFLGFQIRCASQVFSSTSICWLGSFFVGWRSDIKWKSNCNPGKTKKATHLFILQSSLATNLWSGEWYLFLSIWLHKWYKTLLNLDRL